MSHPSPGFGYAIDIHPGLALPHDPIISEDDWVAANLRTIAEAGPEAFLRTIIDVLKGGYIASGDGDDAYDLHAEVDADDADEYVIGRILERLATEVNILGRSAAELRRNISPKDLEVKAEVRRLESDAGVLREAMVASPETWEELSFEAQRLVLHYMIDRVIVGPPTLDSVEEMLKIEWRIPAPAESRAG